MSSLMAQRVAINNLADSYMAFNTNYHDTGLWGIYAVCDPKKQAADDLVWAHLVIACISGLHARARAAGEVCGQSNDFVSGMHALRPFRMLAEAACRMCCAQMLLLCVRAGFHLRMRLTAAAHARRHGRSCGRSAA